jgi:hypothetical protein
MFRRLYLAWRLYTRLKYSWHVAWHKTAYPGRVRTLRHPISGVAVKIRGSHRLASFVENLHS